jgi:hypothetical protein
VLDNAGESVKVTACSIICDQTHQTGVVTKLAQDQCHAQPCHCEAENPEAVGPKAARQESLNYKRDALGQGRYKERSR